MRDEDLISAVKKFIETAKRFGMDYDIDGDPTVDTMKLMEEMMNRIMELENNA